jgi:hypothetical protein
MGETTMAYYRAANDFTDRLKAVYGIPTIKPVVGESFDRNNDLWLVSETEVLHRDGYVTKGSAISVIHDALIDWNRRHMNARDFADYYSDDPTECGFGGV